MRKGSAVGAAHAAEKVGRSCRGNSLCASDLCDAELEIIVRNRAKLVFRVVGVDGGIEPWVLKKLRETRDLLSSSTASHGQREHELVHGEFGVLGQRLGCLL